MSCAEAVESSRARLLAEGAGASTAAEDARTGFAEVSFACDELSNNDSDCMLLPFFERTCCDGAIILAVQ
jgi:hypothetical protein